MDKTNESTTQPGINTPIPPTDPNVSEKIPLQSPVRPPIIVTPTPAAKNGLPTSLLAIICGGMIILVLVTIFSLWFVVKDQQKKPNVSLNNLNPSSKPPVIKNSLINEQNESILAYTKVATTSAAASTPSAKLVVTNLDSQKTIESVIVNPGDNEMITPTLGSWSPTGRYLPILAMTQSPHPVPVFLFDYQNNLLKKIVDDTNTNPSLKSNWSSFLFQSYWKDSQTFVYGPEYIKTSPPTNLVTLDLTGQVGTISSPIHSYTQRSKRLNVKYEFSYNQSGRTDSVREIVMDGKLLNFTPKGRPIGMIENNLVTLEVPVAKTISDLTNDKVFTAKTAKIKDEAQVKQLIEAYLTPIGDPNVYIYDSTGKQVRTFNLSLPNWHLVSVQIRPKEGSLIIHEVDKIFQPKNSRYVEINPENPGQQRIISESPSDNTYDVLLGYGTFGLSPNGNWLIFSEATGSKALEGYSISAININSRIKQTICQNICNNLRIYNPDALTYR